MPEIAAGDNEIGSTTATEACGNDGDALGTDGKAAGLLKQTTPVVLEDRDRGARKVIENGKVAIAVEVEVRRCQGQATGG